MLLLHIDFDWTPQLIIALIVGLAVAGIVTLHLFTDKGLSSTQSPHFYDFDRPDGSANVTPIDYDTLDKIEEYRNDFPDAS